MANVNLKNTEANLLMEIHADLGLAINEPDEEIRYEILEKAWSKSSEQFIKLVNYAEANQEAYKLDETAMDCLRKFVEKKSPDACETSPYSALPAI